MRISVYQMDVIAAKPEENRAKVKSWIERVAREEKPDTILLPEMWTTAYALPELDELADVNGEPTTSFLQELASEHQINIVGGSFANKIEGKTYNTAVVVDRAGEVVHQYSKVHLVPMLDEHLYLSQGEVGDLVFELEGSKMALIICYDLRFPELTRHLNLLGTQVLFIPAEWPSARTSHWKYLQVARAIENQTYVVSANRVGEYNGVQFCGRSMFVDPWGNVECCGSATNEETLTQTVDLNEVFKVREKVPVLQSRVPHLYDAQNDAKESS